MRHILVKERFGVEVPVEFQNKYSAFRYHDKRIKTCQNCDKKYYDQTISNKSKACLICQISILKFNEKQKGGKEEQEVEADVLRHKVCVHCSSAYIDCSKFRGRIYCYRCSSLYSEDYLQDKIKDLTQKNSFQVRQITNFNFWDFEERILDKLNNNFRDVHIVSQFNEEGVPIREYHVKQIRDKHKILAQSYDSDRESCGFDSLLKISKEKLKEYHNLGFKF